MSGVGQVMSGVSHLQSKVMSGVVTHLGQVLDCVRNFTASYDPVMTDMSGSDDPGRYPLSHHPVITGGEVTITV